MILIPMKDQNSFTLEASLDGVSFVLRFDWNVSADFWTMAIFNAKNETVLRGVVLVPNTPLLRQFRSRAVPAGEFVAYLDEPPRDLGRMDFVNQTCQLLYIPEAELATL